MWRYCARLACNLRYQPPLTDEELRAAWIFDDEESGAMELEAADEGATAAAESDNAGGQAAASGEMKRGRRRRKRRRAEETADAADGDG